jgi:hypothetical protein
VVAGQIKLANGQGTDDAYIDVLLEMKEERRAVQIIFFAEYSGYRELRV